ncbi:sensor histidine kinase [Hymenobacter sp. BT175]|uniref:tetratricopeptide repeat-containing sensor histidine kinase n=1 Tax=Hymenobacter translucens TaxID=2886507 RepID=UPI001D0E063F|nr:tetratricopeptide repeat protein [Hymenobacter translucens]MCC2548067.1 sensor histidine kinase [Hymenobacter translucens]
MRRLSALPYRGAGALLLGMLLAPAPGRAQSNPRLDSLEAVLPRQAAPDSIRLQTLNELVWEHRNSNPVRSLTLAAEALELGRRLNSRKGQAKTYILRGIIHATSGRFTESIADFEACRRIRAELGDWQGVAGAINNIGEAQMGQGRYPEAVATYVRALRLEEKYGTPERIAADLANLGTVNYQMGRYREALRYHLRYLRLPGRQPDAHNDALAFNLAGQDFLRLNQPDSALSMFRRALARSKGHADQRNEAQALSNLGGLFQTQGRLVEATDSYQQSLRLQTRLDDQPGRAASLTALADLELAQNRPGPALSLYQQALVVARRIRAREPLRAAYQGLATAYARLGNYPAAYAQQQLAATTKDSLLSEASTRQITEMQTRYETERKEAENRLLQQQQQVNRLQLSQQQQLVQRRNWQLLGGGLALLLLSGLAYLLYSRQRLRTKVTQEQDRQLQERARAKAVLQAEENERRRVGSDLHDGVGQLLSAAKMNLSALEQRLTLPAEDRLLLTNALDIVDESVREVRSISHNLMPNALIKQGLAQAVRDFLHKISPADSRLRIQVEVFGLDQQRLDATLENVLFRVIQELVQNIIKHARATELTLQLIRHEDMLSVLVEDNGVGFSPGSTADDGGIGLQNVESRMAYLGGRALFDSTPGRGTTVTLEVPLRSGPEA